MAIVQQFNPNDPNADPTQQNQQQSSGGGAAPAAGASNAPAPYQNKKGSGRFTNLQNYINANQGAGDRLYQGIGGQVERTLAPEKQEAQSNADKVAQGIKQGQSTLQQGQGFSEQLKGPNFNAEQFTQDPNQLQQFVQSRTGTAVDTNALNQQNQSFQQAQQMAAQEAAQRQEQAGTEAGRFGLLKETFGGRGLATQPSYGAGQQRLDQLFLQSGGGNQVKNLQQNIGQQQAGIAGLEGQTIKNLNGYTDSGSLANIINAQKERQSGLASLLTGQAGDLEAADITGLQSRIDPLNQQRAAEQAAATSAFGALKGGQNAGNLGYNWSTGQTNMNKQSVKDYQKFLQQMGLQEGQASFNAFKNLDNVNQLAQFGRQAQSVQDVANQGDLNKYNALSKLAFGQLGPDSQVNVDQAKQRLTGTSQLEDAVKAIQGQTQGTTAAQDLIKKATDNFWQNEANKNITGGGGQYTGDFGEIATAGSANTNLGDFLRGQGSLATSANTTNYGSAGNLSSGSNVNYNLGDRGQTPLLSSQDIKNQISQLQQGVGLGNVGQPNNVGITGRTVENAYLNPSQFVNTDTGVMPINNAVDIAQRTGTNSPGSGIGQGLDIISGSGAPGLADTSKGISNMTGIGSGGGGRDISGTKQYLGSTERQTLNNELSGGVGLQQNIMRELQRLGYFGRT